MLGSALRSAGLARTKLKRIGNLRSDTCVRRCSPSVRMAIRDTIELDDVESKIFDKLLETCEHHGLSTVLRCAGGWVRDKLLGRPSHDIDIALDNMTGSAFALKVNEYLASKGLETRGIGVIAANPEQSKHLETATLRVDGVSLDFVNLRSETYTDESRIPEMAMGTPLEDAERRDFTINSLFYNLNRRMVEDFTGKGLQDLRDGIIRTPLEPETTFLDDPLRVLRAVRFASRYKFTMVEELVASARTEKVRMALEKKVKRERVGTEVAGMVQGPHPLLAVEQLQMLNYFTAVFQPPDALRTQLGPDFGIPCIEVMHVGMDLLKDNPFMASDDMKRLACLVTLLLPLRQLQVPLKKGRTQALVQYLAREALKWRAKDGENAALVQQQLDELTRLYSQIAQGLEDRASPELRIQLGQCIRRLRDLTPFAVALFPLVSLPQAAPLGSASSNITAASAQTPVSIEALWEQSARMNAAIDEWGLRDCHSWKPLVNGAEIQAAVGMDRPGPLLGQLTDAAIEWQLLHPKTVREPGSEPPSDLLGHLQATYASLKKP